MTGTFSVEKPLVLTLSPTQSSHRPSAQLEITNAYEGERIANFSPLSITDRVVFSVTFFVTVSPQTLTRHATGCKPS